jgi:hypothetical protein
MTAALSGILPCATLVKEIESFKMGNADVYKLLPLPNHVPVNAILGARVVSKIAIAASTSLKRIILKSA